MQGKVDFRERFLFLDGADGIVEVFGLVEVLRRVFHAGRAAQSSGGELRVWVEGGGEGSEGRVVGREG